MRSTTASATLIVAQRTMKVRISALISALNICINICSFAQTQARSLHVFDRFSIQTSWLLHTIHTQTSWLLHARICHVSGIAPAVEDGLLTNESIDRALFNSMRVRFKLGMLHPRLISTHDPLLALCVLAK